MKMPESSHAPDLMRIVSWMSVCCEKFLFVIVIADNGLVSTIYMRIYGDLELCLLKRAANEPSVLHTMYSTGGVVISAIVFCCWISYNTTEMAELRIRLAVPP